MQGGEMLKAVELPEMPTTTLFPTRYLMPFPIACVNYRVEHKEIGSWKIREHAAAETNKHEESLLKIQTVIAPTILFSVRIPCLYWKQWKKRE